MVTQAGSHSSRPGYFLSAMTPLALLSVLKRHPQVDFTIIREQDAYGEGDHSWPPALLALAEEFGLRPRVCRPYRAQTKGKVERFSAALSHHWLPPSNRQNWHWMCQPPMPILAPSCKTSPTSVAMALPVKSRLSDYSKSCLIFYPYHRRCPLVPVPRPRSAPCR